MGALFLLWVKFNYIMGYYSNFSLRLTSGTSDERDKVIGEIESISGYNC